MWPNPIEPDKYYLAYAIGYSDGLFKGVSDNPHDDDPELYRLYKLGYDRGVSDYCAIEHPEDIAE